VFNKSVNIAHLTVKVIIFIVYI